MQDQTLSTRAAAPDDLEYVWAVYKEAVRPHIEPKLKGGWVDSDEHKRFRDTWNSGESHIVLLNDVPIGWGSSVHSNDMVRIQHLYIEPRHRGKGYGSRLVSELIKLWAKEGKTVHAPVLRGSSAINAVLRLGFEKRSDGGDSLTEMFTYSGR